MKEHLNFKPADDPCADFIVCLAHKNMSSWAVDLETAQAMAQDICTYRQHIAKLEQMLEQLGIHVS